MDELTIFWTQTARKLPWGQNMLIIQKEKNYDARAYYLGATDKMAWSSSVPLLQMKSDAHKHHLLIPKQNNFPKSLQENYAEQADESLKSVYNISKMDRCCISGICHEWTKY